MFEYPWDQAPDWANWAATDEDGEQWWFENEPIQRQTSFYVCGNLEEIKQESIGICEDWKESKQGRPT